MALSQHLPLQQVVLLDLLFQGKLLHAACCFVSPPMRLSAWTWLACRWLFACLTRHMVYEYN
jgi:hypothetical protein